MGVLKGLFLGVYASNGGIRTVFLPLCYAVLSSPFFVLALRYYRFDLRPSTYLPQGFSAPDILPQVFISLVAVLLATRVISGKDWNSSKDGRSRRVQLVPYWIPGLRHWGSVVFGGERWLKTVRESSITSIVAISAAGAKHNIVLSAPLLDHALGEIKNLDDADLTKWTVLRNAFNMPNSRTQYLELLPATTKVLEDEIYQGAGMEKLVSSSLSILSETLPDLVTFNSSIVDQMPWERVAGIELTDGTVAAECDLLNLINEFFCNAIIAPITGAHFLESYQLLASDLATLNQSYYALALGLPRFFPIPGLPGAVLAKKRLLQNFYRFFDELMYPPKKSVAEDDESMSGEEETDAETPTPMTALNELFTKRDVPIAACAAITLQLIHSLTSELVPLAFWTLVHIHKSSAQSQGTEATPLEQIKKETKIWAEATQPPSIHPSFPAPPEISFAGVPRVISETSFPYLRSCINEARRLYTASARTIHLSKLLTLSEPSAINPATQDQWELDAGSYLSLGLSQTLINTSPANFLSPVEYKSDRFLHNAAPSSIAFPSDPSNTVTTALLMAFVAGVTQLWDISAAPKKSFFEQMQEAQAAATGPQGATKEPPASQSAGKKKVGTWVVPKAVDGAGVKIPKGDIRVTIRRREGLQERGTLRKGR